jgi:enterochelin esterase family protein
MEMWLARAEREHSPVIDGETAMFVWRGRQAPQLNGDFNGWGGHGGPVELTRVAPELWTYALALPGDAYIEYAYSDEGTLVPDPLNPRTISNGMGALNHFFRMPASSPTPFVRQRSGVVRGVVTDHVLYSEYLIAEGKRTVYLYQPPTSEPTPLLVVFDGQDYLRRARLPQVVDNLIADRRIQPIALALVEHGRQARFLEYICNDGTLAFLAREVLPLARAQLHLLDVAAAPGAYGVLGASMGGLMALYAGLRLPEVFGRVLSQSGAFALDVMGHPSVIYDLIQGYVSSKPPGAPAIWLDVGRYELLLAANQRMRDALEARGFDLAYREYSGGHNYTAWRDDVSYGLEYLFGSGASAR